MRRLWKGDTLALLQDRDLMRCVMVSSNDMHDNGVMQCKDYAMRFHCKVDDGGL